MPTRQRTATALHIPQAPPGRRLCKGPRHRSQLSVQRQHPHGVGQRQLELLILNWLHRVLQTRVVELHHVGSYKALRFQATREVDMHNVKATRAETEVQGLDVDYN